MKHKLALLLALVLLAAALVGCATNPPVATPTPEPTQPQVTETPPEDQDPDVTPDPTEPSAFADQLDGIWKALLAEFPDDYSPMTSVITITAENMEYYLGSADVEMLDGCLIEPAINAIAKCLAFVQVSPDADIEAQKTLIKDNVNPRRWICAGVDPENVLVDNVDDVIILVMDNDHPDDMLAAAKAALAEE